MGRGVPAALAAQAAAAGSPFIGQYNPARPFWLLRPEQLPGSDLTAAFETEDRAAALPLVGFPPPLWLPPQIPAAPSGFGGFGAASGTGQVAAPLPTLSPFPTLTPLPPATSVSVQPSPTPSPTPNPVPPVIDRTEPGAVPVGRDITLRGRGFGAEPGHVLFTGKLTTAQIWSDTHIIVTVPDGAVDGTIRIRRPDGVFSNEVGFAPLPTPTTASNEPTQIPTPTITPTPGPPVVAELVPFHNVNGNTFLVRGSAFGNVAGQVLMGGSQALIDSNGWSETSIVAQVPSDMGAGTVRVSVRRGTDGQLSNFRCYQVFAPTPTAGTGTATPTPIPTPAATAAAC